MAEKGLNPSAKVSSERFAQKVPGKVGKIRKIQLALMFAAMVFLILLATMLVVFSGIFLLQKLGLQLVDEISRVPLFCSQS